MEPVLDYIHQQSLKAVEHEQNAKRAAPLTKFEVGSPYAHVWLYSGSNVTRVQQAAGCRLYKPSSHQSISVASLLCLLVQCGLPTMFPTLPTSVAGPSCGLLCVLHCTPPPQAGGCRIHEGHLQGGTLNPLCCPAVQCIPGGGGGLYSASFFELGGS